jgi:hypothetical protein
VLRVVCVQPEPDQLPPIAGVVVGDCAGRQALACVSVALVDADTQWVAGEHLLPEAASMPGAVAALCRGSALLVCLLAVLPASSALRQFWAAWL